MDNPIDQGCVTSKELPVRGSSLIRFGSNASLELVERIPKTERPKLSALPEPLDQRGPQRMTLAIFAACAGSARELVGKPARSRKH
jgi:hypothetical protein